MPAMGEPGSSAFADVRRQHWAVINNVKISRYRQDILSSAARLRNVHAPRRALGIHKGGKVERKRARYRTGGATRPQSQAEGIIAESGRREVDTHARPRVARETSPSRLARTPLAALAVQKLAAAYKTDEIASSVMVMQGGSVFDDIAERVLKVDPHDIDARYVHFFHEKIPSRQLAESTSTQVLDELIAEDPHRLEFYRTRGIVHCFRDEYALAAKDFTHALKEARALRKARVAHMNGSLGDKQRSKGGKKKKGKAGGSKSHGQAPPSGTGALADGSDGVAADGSDRESAMLHPSVLPDAPEPIEPQCLFLRAAAYLQHAVYLIEDAILKLEGIRKISSIDGRQP
ncbi:hypothetical protein NUW54_g11432 [Trametes sanguinea]|uniref:Uncharacterized protein n=1 Tax=Trametes sanguinea TaxID=158606 RepID=A0ACC1NFP2_9APHY|nr:hypothetical protein NUW54_g11432 [Trametes sanguinea]